MSRYKFTTYKKDGQYAAIGIAADRTHSFVVGVYESRREARKALAQLMARDASIEVVKRMNYRRELPSLETLSTA